MEKKTKSTILSYLYGSEYESELGQGCINLANESSCPATRKFGVRALAALLISINIYMEVSLFGWGDMFTQLTNWCL